ncbi:hypothetical protein TNCV_4537331 [Trichonephila clavipes]|nr:hypothetical protein TNCV_4537331 [Trichonephila clavipes]
MIVVQHSRFVASTPRVSVHVNNQSIRKLDPLICHLGDRYIRAALGLIFTDSENRDSGDNGTPGRLSGTFNARVQGLINLAGQMKRGKSARATEIRSGRVVNGGSPGSARAQRKQPSKKEKPTLQGQIR